MRGSSWFASILAVSVASSEPGLECNAAGEFKTARAGALGGLQRGDGAKAARVGLHVGRLVIAVIEDVGAVNAEQEFRFFGEGDALGHRERKIRRARADDAPDAGSAEVAAIIERNGKRGRWISRRLLRRNEPLAG